MVRCIPVIESCGTRIMLNQILWVLGNADVLNRIGGLCVDQPYIPVAFLGYGPSGEKIRCLLGKFSGWSDRV